MLLYIMHYAIIYMYHLRIEGRRFRVAHLHLNILYIIYKYTPALCYYIYILFAHLHLNDRIAVSSESVVLHHTV